MTIQFTSRGGGRQAAMNREKAAVSQRKVNTDLLWHGKQNIANKRCDSRLAQSVVKTRVSQPISPRVKDIF